jgi:hypothetical protein
MTCGCFGLKDCCGLTDIAKEKVESYESVIKDGFTDVVIRANDFCEGSEKAHMLLEHTHRVVQYMYRDKSQTTLCVLGVSGIATVCASVVFMIVNFAEPYKTESSSLYIANPALVVFLAWVLGAYISFGFMSAWDHAADTLLFCYAWNRKFSRGSVEKYIPESVRAIVGYDDSEDDRYPYYGKAKSNMYLRTWMPVPEKKEGGKRKVTREEPRERGESPQTSWFNTRTWMGRQEPKPPAELQSLLVKD